ncbi:Target of rapamycin complex subunit LST8 [Galdieria sulphuraria]|nr:Target of rapamycin complex subunit LST8 [Galdieria sulphuraria]
MKTPKTLVSGGYDHSIRFWDLKTAKPIRSVPFHSSHINQVKFSLDGRLLAVCGNPLVEFYDLRTNTEKSLWDLRIISPLQSWKSSFPFSCICYGRDESEIITSDYSGAARIWDIATQKESGRLKTRDSSILTGFLYERAHSLFIMFGSSGFVYISLLRPKKASASLRVEHTYVYGKSNYEVEHEAKGYFEKITKLRATKRYVLKASLSDEGLLLANANEDGDIKLWGDKNNPDAYNESRWQQQVTLVSASSDKKILLWNWEKRLLLQEFLGHEKTVTSLDFYWLYCP